MGNLTVILTALTCLIGETGNCQSLNAGFDYLDPYAPQEQIVQQVSRLMDVTDSIENANNVHARTVYHVALIVTDTSNIPDEWVHYESLFIRELIRQVGEDNVRVHDAMITTPEGSITNRLSVGPLFVEFTHCSKK